MRRGDVPYSRVPMFHGNAVIADWSSALAVAPRLCCAGSSPGPASSAAYRPTQATCLTCVGRAGRHILATPGPLDDSLPLGFGAEGGAVGATRFAGLAAP